MFYSSSWAAFFGLSGREAETSGFFGFLMPEIQKREKIVFLFCVFTLFIAFQVNHSIYKENKTKLTKDRLTENKSEKT